MFLPVLVVAAAAAVDRRPVLVLAGSGFGFKRSQCALSGCSAPGREFAYIFVLFYFIYDRDTVAKSLKKRVIVFFKSF